MDTFTSPFALLNHISRLNISIHQDTTHEQVSYVVASLKMIGLKDIADTITSRFRQFDNETSFNPRLLNIKTDFVVDKTKHPEFFIRFATLIGCDNASNLLRVYFMPD